MESRAASKRLSRSGLDLWHAGLSRGGAVWRRIACVPQPFAEGILEACNGLELRVVCCVGRLLKGVRQRCQSVLEAIFRRDGWQRQRMVPEVYGV